MAATGALWGDRCFPSQADALDAFYLAKSSAEVPGSTTYVIQYAKESGLWKSQGYSIDGAGVWTLRYSTVAPTPSFPVCDPTEPFFDGVTIGWAFASAMVAVACLKLIQKATG